MSEVEDEIRLERKSKDEMNGIKQKKLEAQAEKLAKGKGKSYKRKLQPEQKSRIIVLNIVQLVILVFAILVEVLTIYDYIPQVFSIIGLAVLSVSCVLIMKKINRIISE